MSGSADRRDLAARVAALPWYHTIDLGDGIVTPGIYDHRPYLAHYAIPADLAGKTALDIGTASGFFAFEMERRGARVTATDLPDWTAHDFGPQYRVEGPSDAANTYLHAPFDVARQALGSSVERRLISVYDLAPETVGMFDLVFCGSLLIHLTDPIRALWRIASVTRERAIIATVLARAPAHQPIAQMTGFPRGDTWWAPTRRCLEALVACAGFQGIEWIGEFTLDHRDGTPGPLHGVVHGWMTTEGWGPNVVPVAEFGAHLAEVDDPHARWLHGLIVERDREIGWLRDIIRGYERGRYIRFMRRLRGLRRPAPTLTQIWERGGEE